MLCPNCPGDMKYFKDYERDVDGYICPLCNFEKILVPIVIDEDVEAAWTW